MKTKSKITAAVVGLLSVVALAGTGYAGWVISQNASGNADGGMIAYNIKDNGVKVSDPTWQGDKNNNKIIWGKPATLNATHSWFNFTDDVENEQFEPVLMVTVTNNETDDDVEPAVTAKLKVTDDNDGNYANCLAKNYISGPAADSEPELLVTKNTESSSAVNTFTYTISRKNKADNSVLFGWGSHFKSEGEDKNLNPYDFYNKKAVDDTSFKDAGESMAAIAKLNNIKFNISIEASHGVSSK